MRLFLEQDVGLIYRCQIDEAAAFFDFVMMSLPFADFSFSRLGVSPG